MRQSALFATTLRDAPADADAASHQLLLRAGFIRQLAAGVYTYLPLGWRVLRAIERIVREEMDRSGAQELLMPAMQPAELWKESGRYNAYGPELIRLQDRHGREFALGPTHEEVITSLVRNEISSYRKLPVTLYQIQTKFRDERRPRFGLLRGREFLMKDAYSFDTDWEGLDRSYRSMYDAYMRIFTRCGLEFRPVEADAGTIGGQGETHEFMALTQIGEDTIATCPYCGYAANLEKAQAFFSVAAPQLPQQDESHGTTARMDNEEAASPALIKLHTPDVRTIGQLTRYLNIAPQAIIKTLIYCVDGNPYAVLVRGDHEVNELKVLNALGGDTIQLADAQTTVTATGAPVGFAGPVGLTLPLLVDEAVAAMETAVAGANEGEYHLAGVIPGCHFPLIRTGDFRTAKEGDRCLRCGEGQLQFSKGIEVGHVFKLGTKYSEPLAARYLDTNGREQSIIMGCYGIGISRLLSAIAEQHHDERGVIWPWAIAPYQIHILVISTKDAVQMALAEELYHELKQQGMEVLLDDRDERAGVKLNDSDLFGIPLRIVVGKHAAEGRVEYTERAKGEKQILTRAEAQFRALEMMRSAGKSVV